MPIQKGPLGNNITTSEIADGNVTYAKLASDIQRSGMKNRVINGAMVIDQRNAGASVTQTVVNANTYMVDRWKYYANTGSSKFSYGQNAGAVTPPPGFSTYLGFTSLTANTPAATDEYIFAQTIEGYNVADLNWGTANAKAITLSFWVRSSLTGGNFGAVVKSADAGYSYPFNYTVSSANTWTQISVTIPGPTTGTFGSTTGAGFTLQFNLGTGSTYLAGTSGAWLAGFSNGPVGSLNILGTNGATFYLTGVQLEAGSTSTNFEYRQYGTELTLCQRYYWQQGGKQYSRFGGGIALGRAAAIATTMVNMPVPMRTYPTITLSGGSSSVGGQVVSSISTDPLEASLLESTGPLLVRIVVPTGLSVGTGYEWETTGGAAVKLTYSAEL